MEVEGGWWDNSLNFRWFKYQPRWWFQIVFYFRPDPWGSWTHFDELIFFKWVVQPPTGCFYLKELIDSWRMLMSYEFLFSLSFFFFVCSFQKNAAKVSLPLAKFLVSKILAVFLHLLPSNHQSSKPNKHLTCVHWILVTYLTKCRPNVGEFNTPTKHHAPRCRTSLWVLGRGFTFQEWGSSDD